MDEKISLLKEYNLWGSGNLDWGYQRSEYTDKITSYIGNRLVKVLVGQRRSGKSYILRQVAKQLVNNGIKPENTLLINRELTDFDFLRTYKDLDELIKLYKKEINPSGKVFIFIDEIQIIDGWEKIVNSYSQDFAKSYELFISGSNSKMLSGELATLLSGRYVCFEVFPFSYSEYLGIIQQERGRQSYLDYMNSGGLPELFMIQKSELKRNYISAIKDTVLLRDIIQRHNIRDPRLLEDIFIFLINNASNLISISNIVKYFKGLGRRTSFDAVSLYIGYIGEAFLIHRCDRYDIRGKDTISGNAKFYINDLSYKNYLYSGYGYGYGYLVENLVYLELRRKEFDVYIGTLRNKEIDFVAKQADRVIYLQSCYMLSDETTVEREYSSLESINDSFEKVIVSLDEIKRPLRNGIQHIQAWNLDDLF
ncbi:MAG: ATP-binding protein [Proteiniphilum sp.]|jgi:predicted AAA+ superfamily ATPase|uniref:ATP-binding protein n=1 Tax=Proteiniphilum sp. TaxID=1926877 RepID=UPI00092CCEC3|nr:ATP-binding protein [Proteiniphilum sp.]MEA5129320.1 ATP-binding protein [Proteiniphilum sp.]OJV87397.1 MAG: AAA family ATPase [Bacteroidia bacterium 44-10]